VCGLLGVLGTAAALAAPARASTVDIAPELDCTISYYSSQDNDCESTELLAGRRLAHDTQAWQALLQFDVEAELPPGAVVTSATLRLNGGVADIPAQSPAGAWDDAVKWDSYPGIGGVEDTATLDGAWSEWDVTRLVSAWAAGTEPNYGISVGEDPLSWSETPNGDNEATYASSEAGSGVAPELVVEFSVTTCPSDPYAAAQVTSEDSVYYWNEVLLDVVRAHTPSTPPTPPTRMSRAAAMMHTAIFDTMNSAFFAELEDGATGSPSAAAQCGWKPFVVLADAEPNIDVDLAVGVAARDVLLNTYPGFATQINAAFTTRNGSDNDDDAEDLGEFVADEVIASRASDGSTASMSYTSDPLTAGAWRPTPTLSTEAPCDDDGDVVTPGWGNVTPFTLGSGSQYRIASGHTFYGYAGLLPHSMYAEDFEEVKDLGNRDENVSNRTSDQTEAAFFWANDLPGTYKPPGQLLEHTRLVALTQPAAITSGAPGDFRGEWSRQGIRVARLFALVSIGMGDAAIAAWDTKFLTPVDLWRPISAIHNASADGNSSTQPDTGWQPLSQDRNGVSFSPCFPAWVSGHATFGGVWSRVLENEFDGTDHDDPFPLTLTTEDPHAEQLPAPAVGFVTRSFDSFSEAAEENASSRIWLGVHYRIDADGGLGVGRSVGTHVSANALRWTQGCAAWSCGETIP
jgi:hypothetical protein